MSEEGKPLLDAAVVGSLLQRLAESDVDELEIVYGEARLYVRRAPGQQAVVLPAAPAAEVAVPGVPVRAPLTGIFYPRPDPNQPLFVSVGEQIEVGQVVGLIETMKLFNEVTSDLAGEVITIDAHEGDLVEAGQPLLYVRAERGEA